MSQYEKEFKIIFLEYDDEGNMTENLYEIIININYTISDIKKYIEEEKYKENYPICNCLLSVCKYDSENENYFLCEDYDDSTYLKDTIFIELQEIYIFLDNERECKCGQLEKLKIISNLEKQREEDTQRWEEKERENEKNKEEYQKEIKKLKDIMDMQIKENKEQIKSHKEQLQKWKEKERENEKNKEEYQKEIKKLKDKMDEQIKENKKQIKSHKEQLNQEKMDHKRNIDRLEKKINTQNIKHQEEINRIKDENESKISYYEKERRQADEYYKYKFYNLEQLLSEKNDQIKNITKTMQENEDQKKILEKSEKEAEKEFISQNPIIYENYFKNNKISLSKQIENKINKLIDEKISFENINENTIFKTVKNEKFSKYVKDFFDNNIKNINNENMYKNINSFNIIILGNTGVGKSTLLNAVLKKKLAKTKFGDVCTMGVPKPYESDNAKGIRIWDTRGIENGKYNLETAFNDIKNTIESLIKENDPDKFIHCIWYCIRSNRFTEEEADNLKNCYNFYIDKLPIIVVFTLSENQIETDQMIEKVKNKLEKIKNLKEGGEKGENEIKILKVLAEDYKHVLGDIKSFGIHNLMEQTCESAKIGIERAITHSLVEQGQELLKEEFNEIIKRLKEFDNKNEITDKKEIKESKDKKEVKDNKKIKDNQSNNSLNNNGENKKKFNFDMKSIGNFDYNNFIRVCKALSREIMQKLLLKDTISEETISEIDKIMDNETEKVKEFLDKIFEKQLEDISNKLTEELVDFVAQLEAKYQINKLSSKYHYNELKRQAKKNIINQFKPMLEDIIYAEISQMILIKFAKKVSNELLKCLHYLLENNKKIKEIFSSKGKEKSLACLQKIKKVMNYPKDDYEIRNPKKKSKYEELNEDDD